MFASACSLSSIGCPSTLHRHEIIEEFSTSSSHSPMFDQWVASDVLSPSSGWDHWRIFLIIFACANVLSLCNIGCPFSLLWDDIIEEFLLTWTHSPMLDHWPTSDILLLSIGMTPLNNFSDDKLIQESLMNDQYSMCSFSSSKWDHSRTFIGRTQ